MLFLGSTFNKWYLRADKAIILYNLSKSLESSFKKAISDTTKRTVIIADTVKGKGVSFMENNPGFHGKAPTVEQLIAALHELKFSKKSVLEAGKQMNISDSLLSKISENY